VSPSSKLMRWNCISRLTRSSEHRKHESEHGTGVGSSTGSTGLGSSTSPYAPSSATGTHQTSRVGRDAGMGAAGVGAAGVAEQ